MSATEAQDLQAAAIAALLELMRAAREWHRAGVRWEHDVEHRLDDAVERLEVFLLELEPKHVWRPGTWAEVRGSGTRVRLGGVEATVESAVMGSWHVDPLSPSRSPRPLEHSTVRVRLIGRDQTYTFPPGNAVEILDVSWPLASQADWAAAAMAAQQEQAVQILTEAFSARVEP